MITNTESGTSTKQYALAGWLAIIHAVLILPKAGIELLFEITPQSSANYLQLITGFHASGLILGIYVLFMFKRFLNDHHQFHKADTLIIILILFKSVGLVIDIAGIILASYSNVISANIILYGLTSAISIIYAIKLLKLNNDLLGLLKPYVYLTIASGICGATLILQEIASLIYMASLIILGIILIRTRSEFDYL
jgi:hypothetical protein